MANWNYNPADYAENDFAPIPVGDHRVRIQEAKERSFNSGREGFEITLEVSGMNSRLWYYLVLDPSDVKKTNQRIGSFFDSFGITDTNLGNYRGWVGKVGAVKVRHEDYNGNPSAKVHYCISKSKQTNLAPWKEPNSGSAMTVVIDDEDLPFV